MLHKSVVRPALIAAGILGFAVSTASAEDWKCYTYQSGPMIPVVKGLEQIGAELTKVTKGRVNVKCSLGGTLPIDANSIAPALSDGVLDFVTASNVSGYVPIAAMNILPGFYGSIEEMRTKGWPIFKPYIDKEFEKRGIKVLGIYHYPDQVIWGGKGATPLKSLADLKGKTLRTGNPEQALFAKAIGAVPVTLPTPDVAPALQRGAIQYTITAAAAGGVLWRDFLASGLLQPLYVATSYILVNKKRWDSLSAEEQKVFQAAVDKVSWETMTKEQLDKDAASVAEFKKQGWTIVEGTAATKAEIIKVMTPIWKDWAKERGPDAVEAMDKIRSALDKRS